LEPALGKERRRVLVFSEGGMSGGHAIEIRVDSGIEREVYWIDWMIFDIARFLLLKYSLVNSLNA
jgi:hypothetical protein